MGIDYTPWESHEITHGDMSDILFALRMRAVGNTNARVSLTPYELEALLQASWTYQELQSGPGTFKYDPRQETYYEPYRGT